MFWSHSSRTTDNKTLSPSLDSGDSPSLIFDSVLSHSESSIMDQHVECDSLSSSSSSADPIALVTCGGATGHWAPRSPMLTCRLKARGMTEEMWKDFCRKVHKESCGLSFRGERRRRQRSKIQQEYLDPIGCHAEWESKGEGRHILQVSIYSSSSIPATSTAAVGPSSQ